MAQAPYSPPAVTPTDDLADMVRATTMEILSTPDLLSFLASKQRKTLESLLEEFRHPAAALVQSYVE